MASRWVLTRACLALALTYSVAAPRPDPPPPGVPVPDAAPLRIAFAGDVHFVQRTAGLRSLGPAGTLLARADLAVVNLETAVTTRGTPEPKDFHFRAPPAVFEALRRSGVDAVSMANNHAVDYGAQGLADTLAASEAAGFPVLGLGRTERHAYAPWYAEVRGQRVAVLAASQIDDRTLRAWHATASSPGIASAYSSRLLQSVRKARRRADIVVVYLHWGEEGNGCPVAVQVALAHQLADAGADAVVGSSAHVLQGAGWLGRTYVSYGLGNFVWWRDASFSDETGVLTLTLRGRHVTQASLAPALIDARGLPVPAHGPDATRIRDEWDRLRGCAGLASSPPP